MNSLTAWKASTGILGAIAIALAVLLFLPKTPLDGNPIGFHLWANKIMNAGLGAGSSTTLPACMSSGNQQCFMSVHYLQLSGTPPATPTCPPSSGTNTYYCPQDLSPQVLPSCPPSNLCVVINTGTNNDANPDMLVQSQDGEGGVHYQASTIGELEFIIGPTVTASTPAPGTNVKTPQASSTAAP